MPRVGEVLHVVESLESLATFCGRRSCAEVRMPWHLGRLVSLTSDELAAQEVCRTCVAEALKRFAGAAASAAAVLGRLDGKLR